MTGPTSPPNWAATASMSGRKTRLMPRRARLLPNGIVGVTCHDSRHLAMEAGEAGADYVAFGAFFPTATKEAKTARRYRIAALVGEDMLVPWSPSAASPSKMPRALVEAGADFLAVSAGSGNIPKGPKRRSRPSTGCFRHERQAVGLSVSGHPSGARLSPRHRADLCALLPRLAFFQDYWYVPLIAVPAALLALLAWSLGFYRRRRGGRIFTSP